MLATSPFSTIPLASTFESDTSGNPDSILRKTDPNVSIKLEVAWGRDLTQVIKEDGTYVCTVDSDTQHIAPISGNNSSFQLLAGPKPALSGNNSHSNYRQLTIETPIVLTWTSIFPSKYIQPINEIHIYQYPFGGFTTSFTLEYYYNGVWYPITTTINSGAKEIIQLPDTIQVQKIRYTAHNGGTNGARLVAIEAYNFSDESSYVLEKNPDTGEPDYDISNKLDSSQNSLPSNGVMTIALNNLDNRYSQYNTDSPIYGYTQANGKGSGVQTGCPIRLTALADDGTKDYSQIIFNGFISDDNNPGGSSGLDYDLDAKTVTLTSKSFTSLIDADVNLPVYSGQTFDTIIKDILYRAGIADQNILIPDIKQIIPVVSFSGQTAKDSIEQLLATLPYANIRENYDPPVLAIDNNGRLRADFDFSAIGQIQTIIPYGDYLFLIDFYGNFYRYDSTQGTPSSSNCTLLSTSSPGKFLGIYQNYAYFIASDPKYVAVAQSGSGNRVMTTQDGINWTSQTSAADLTWTSITVGNGLFVAVASSGTGNRVMTSPDGIHWTSRTSAADNNWTSVCYGNGLFVAVASSGTGNRVMTSPDGITWTIRSSAADQTWNSVCYGNGLFVAVAGSGTGTRVMTSRDGIIWQLQNSAEDNFWTSVCYGNGLFVAVANTGVHRVMISSDGQNWSAISDIGGITWAAVTYGLGLFVAVAGSTIMTSSDGKIWTSRTSPSSASWSNVAFTNGLFVATESAIGTNNTMYSLDGINWSLSAASPDQSWVGLTVGTGAIDNAKIQKVQLDTSAYNLINLGSISTLRSTYSRYLTGCMFDKYIYFISAPTDLSGFHFFVVDVTQVLSSGVDKGSVSSTSGNFNMGANGTYVICSMGDEVKFSIWNHGGTPLTTSLDLTTKIVFYTNLWGNYPYGLTFNNYTLSKTFLTEDNYLLSVISDNVSSDAGHYPYVTIIDMATLYATTTSQATILGNIPRLNSDGVVSCIAITVSGKFLYVAMDNDNVCCLDYTKASPIFSYVNVGPLDTSLDYHTGSLIYQSPTHSKNYSIDQYGRAYFYTRSAQTTFQAIAYYISPQLTAPPSALAAFDVTDGFTISSAILDGNPIGNRVQITNTPKVISKTVESLWAQTQAQYLLKNDILVMPISLTESTKTGRYLYFPLQNSAAPFLISMTRSGSTVTVNITNHGVVAGDLIYISGCDQSEYNGYWPVAGVTDSNNFTFSITTTPVTPASGNFTVCLGIPDDATVSRSITAYSLNCTVQFFATSDFGYVMIQGGASGGLILGGMFVSGYAVTDSSNVTFTDQKSQTIDDSDLNIINESKSIYGREIIFTVSSSFLADSSSFQDFLNEGKYAKLYNDDTKLPWYPTLYLNMPIYLSDSNLGISNVLFKIVEYKIDGWTTTFKAQEVLDSQFL